MRTCVVAALAVTIAAGASGCTAGPSAGVEERAFREVRAPAFRSRDVTLPAGCIVYDHTSKLAMYRRTTGSLEGPDAVGLVDLASGRSADVVIATETPGAIAILGVALSDSWIAWEEVTGAEDEWRLLAAPIDGLSAGEPILVDQDASAERYRPLFDLDGSRLVWMCSGQTARNQGVELRAADLPGREHTMIYKGPGIMNAMRLKRHEAIATLRETPGGETVLVIDVERREVTRRIPIGNQGPTSHWVDIDGDTIAWAAFDVTPSGLSVEPAVFARRAGEATVTLCEEGCDPTVLGRYVFFETAPTAVGGTPRGLSGVDLKEGTRFKLVDDTGPMTAFWQLVTPVVDAGGLLLAYKDEWSFEPEDREAVSLLRVWEVP